MEEAVRIVKGGRSQDTCFSIYGADFDTPDGTCIRDYIHVHDICTAHLAAMKRLLGNLVTGAEVYNLGNGHGFSVKEVIESCRRVTGVDISYRIAERRIGDAAWLIGNAEKAREYLFWVPTITSLREIITTAWKWHCKASSVE